MMISIMQNERFPKILFQIVFWIAVWHVIALIVHSDLILPAPLTVLKKMMVMTATKEFWAHTAMTLFRIFLGYLSGLLIGTILAILSCISPLLDTVISPMIKTVRATPVASFIILALLWLGKNIIPSLMAALMVIPIVWGNIVEAYKAVDRKMLEMSEAYRLNGFKRMRYIYVPSVMPYFKAACLTSMGFSWKSAIAAEVLTQPTFAIGSNLYYSKVYLETPELFAWTTVVIILSFLIEKCIRLLMGRHRKDHDYGD